MHFGIKCICNILCYKMYASNAFLHQMHFCIKCIFAPTKCTHLCFLQSKKHSIFASNAFVTFCFAEHFPLENVMPKCIFAQPKCIFASNAFLHQQNVRIFVFCKAKNTAFLHSQNAVLCLVFFY